jgi:hypothetical protein
MTVSDPTLPPYYAIRYCILLACSHDTWAQGDRWKNYAEETYISVLNDARARSDTDSLYVLSLLRKELDRLYATWMKDMTGMTRKERYEIDNRSPVVEDQEEAAPEEE